jgi:hypothetical protein
MTATGLLGTGPPDALAPIGGGDPSLGSPALPMGDPSGTAGVPDGSADPAPVSVGPSVGAVDGPRLAEGLTPGCPVAAVVGAGVGRGVGLGVGGGVPDPPTWIWKVVERAFVEVSRTHHVTVWLPAVSGPVVTVTVASEPAWSQAQSRTCFPSMPIQPSARSEAPSVKPAWSVGVEPTGYDAPTPVRPPMAGPEPSAVPLPPWVK